MLKFFRSIRKNLLTTSKTGKYFQYAIGEIILVVIGILLALQINNWNTQRIAKSSIQNYYERMYFEIESEIKSVESFISTEERLISMNKRTLMMLDSKAQDSIPSLKETLGALATSWTLTVKFPVTEEFMDQGYLSKIENDSLKLAFRDFAYALENIRMMNEYISNQYNDRIEPFINKQMNYSEVALPIYLEYMVQGGPPTDFESLFGNLELWNIVTFKLEGLNLDIRGNRRLVQLLNHLNAQIRKELKQTNMED
jgi:hypothetical protein